MTIIVPFWKLYKGGSSIGKAILDFTGCKYYSEFHKRIQEALQFPEYYGKWDSLMWERSVEYVEIHGEHTLSEEWKPQIEKMHEIIGACKESVQKMRLGI